MGQAPSRAPPPPVGWLEWALSFLKAVAPPYIAYFREAIAAALRHPAVLQAIHWCCTSCISSMLRRACVMFNNLGFMPRGVALRPRRGTIHPVWSTDGRRGFYSPVNRCGIYNQGRRRGYRRRTGYRRRAGRGSGRMGTFCASS